VKKEEEEGKDRFREQQQFHAIYTNCLIPFSVAAHTRKLELKAFWGFALFISLYTKVSWYSAPKENISSILTIQLP